MTRRKPITDAEQMRVCVNHWDRIGIMSEHLNRNNHDSKHDLVLTPDYRMVRLYDVKYHGAWGDVGSAI